MKKAFTLVELMIVVVVIIILLAISFRLMSVGGDAAKRNTTIARMQRVENALSGYFAAFGSYPPVALHGSRDVYARLDANGNQQQGGETGALEWESVEAACKAQPVSARYPFAKTENTEAYVEMCSRSAVELVNDRQFPAWTKVADKLGGGFTALRDPSQASGWRSKKTWQEVKIFQFGVMSFLLPRYLFMTEGVDPDDLQDCAQWGANNQLSANPNTGGGFSHWEQQLTDKRLVARIPSQAVCARWMPNFEGIVSCNPIEKNDARFFGIDVSESGMALAVNASGSPKPVLDCLDVENHTVLNVMTVRDGWGNEFYYYSPVPFQSYRLWSAGANEKTFPPWTPLETLKNASDRRTAANWMADDIMYLSN